MKQAWKKYLLYASAAVGTAILAYILIETVRLRNTGFEVKTLWDWMELLIIPAFLAGGAYYLQRSEKAVERKAAEDRAKLERELTTDRQQEAALQAYLDRMTELLLKGKLGESEDERVLKVKRVRTLTVMRVLNADRNEILLRFLRDIGLAGKPESNLFVNANLEGADLEGVDFSNTNLEKANLRYARLVAANLQNANLRNATLISANLKSANLAGANLERAILVVTNLERAILNGANLKVAQLDGANLQGAQLKDANLVSALLRGTNLNSANLEGANLEIAILQLAKLQYSILENANLRGSVLAGANLKSAVVKGIKLEGAIMPDGTKHD
jgi:uncharacterized protein YjbI with pentapeptide repeats